MGGEKGRVDAAQTINEEEDTRVRVPASNNTFFQLLSHITALRHSGIK